MAIAKDNIRHLAIGDFECDLEASLGAGIVYANQFRGRLEAPYKGIFEDDILETSNRARETVTMTVKADKRGRPIRRDGEYVPADSGVQVEVPNTDQYVDVESCIRIAWAMARSVDPDHGRPYEGTYEDFFREVAHQSAGVFEQVQLYRVVVLELGGGVTFRRPDGRRGAGASDATHGQEA